MGMFQVVVKEAKNDDNKLIQTLLFPLQFPLFFAMLFPVLFPGLTCFGILWTYFERYCVGPSEKPLSMSS